MRKISILIIISLSLFSLMVTSSFANEPNTIPWPVGSTEAIMNSTKTLMNSYGDPQNDWMILPPKTGHGVKSLLETMTGGNHECSTTQEV